MAASPSGRRAARSTSWPTSSSTGAAPRTRSWATRSRSCRPGIDVTLREPVGVCALITPWNFPAVIASWKIAPALACGNTAVVKPASARRRSPRSRSPTSSTSAGLPDGTLSVLPGPGSTTASALIADPRVAKISFTGSTEVGIDGDAGRRRRTSRGSRSSWAASRPTWSSTTPTSTRASRSRCGRCSTTRARTAAHGRASSCSAAIYDEFVERFAARTDAIAVGEPLDESTEMGPLISSGTAPDLARLPRDRHRRRRPPRDRRRRARRRRVLHAPGGARRRRQRLARRAGGDLRSGRLPDALRHRRGSRPPRERLAVRAVGHDLDPRPGPSDPGRQGHPHRATSA